MNIALETVVVDDRARDGTWCTLPYPGHPHGCPNYPECIESRPHFSEYPILTWTAVVERFDLALHARKMKIKHPLWSRRQCRNLLYWQGGVRKRLREKARKIARPVMGDIILEIPEANGVDVYKTMENHGLKLERDPDIVHKIMFVGQVN
jgi:hypothetical protein